MASMEVKLRAERAAVERATSEARDRALQKALSEKASHRSREQAGRHPAERSSSLDPKYHSSSSYSKGGAMKRGKPGRIAFNTTICMQKFVESCDSTIFSL